MKSKEIPLSEKWKTWMDLAHAANMYTFPVYNPVEQVWMVFEPDSNNYMLVSDEVYRDYFTSREMFVSRYRTPSTD